MPQSTLPTSELVEETPVFEFPRAFAELVVGTHRLALLRDGAQAFPAMLSAIAKARSTICLETYILRDDRKGREFADALIERARAGVEVNLLYDAWGSSIGSGYVDDLRRGGVRTVAFHPIKFGGEVHRAIATIGRRDHRKALVVDGRIAFTGGINIADEYAPLEEGGRNWRDTHLAIEGPAALELEYFFRDTWRRTGGAPLDEARYGGQGRRPDPLVTVITSDLRGGRLGIREMYRTAINNAKERIWITNAYFLPTLRLFGALTQAAKRGVDVRVMIAGTTDVPAVLLAARSLYDKLLAAGVRMFEWRGRVLHAKTAVVDGRWSTVGSSNLDHQSLRFNLEANARVDDARFARALEVMFEDDLAHAIEIDVKSWGKRQPWNRALSWGAWLFRDWL